MAKKPELKWTDAISVNEDTIDKQHASLIKKIGELDKNKGTNDAGVVRGIISFLGKYASEHFQYEENYMKMNGFPGLKRHAGIHRKFTVFFGKYKKEFDKIYSAKKLDAPKLRKFAEKARDFLAKWLMYHIAHEDMKYADYIAKKVKKPKKSFDMSAIKSEIQQRLKEGKIADTEAQIIEQRAPIEHVVDNTREKKADISKSFVKTGVPGFDELLEHGIPKGYSVITAGGAGSGKTIFCLQTIMHHVEQGHKCFYMSFEESEERLIEHMEEFGWEPRKYIKKGLLRIKRYSPFEITRSIEAMLEKEKGDLLIDLHPIILPADFKPDIIALDSLTAVASAFVGKEDSYRIYIEQLFRFFEKLGSTNFLITETKQIPEIFSTTGVEEFLADGVIVMYNIKQGDVRENAVEVLKMRGTKHQKKIVAMQITDAGMVIYPDQEVFGSIPDQ